MYRIGDISRLVMGRPDENNVYTFQIDMSEWAQSMPEMRAGIWNTRPKEIEEPYPLMTSMEGDIMTVTLTSYDTAIEGRGCAVVVAFDGKHKFRRSKDLLTIVDHTELTIRASDEPPYFPWYAEVMEAGQRAVVAATEAEQSAFEAANSAAEADFNATLAIKAADEAEAAKVEAKKAADEILENKDEIVGEINLAGANQQAAISYTSTQEQMAMSMEAQRLTMNITAEGTAQSMNVIAAGEAAVKDVDDELEDAKNQIAQNGRAQTTAVALAGQNAIKVVNGARDIAIEDIEAKTDEQLERIPDLTKAVEDGKKAIEEKTDEQLERIPEVTALKANDAVQDGRLDALESRPVVDKSLTRRVANLEAAAQGNLYREETDSEAAHIKTVPPDAMPWALLDTIGGHSEVIGGTLMSFGPARIISRGANLYDEGKYPRVSGGIRWNTGVIYTSSASLRTPYIPISDFRGMTLSYNSNSVSDVGGCAFYDDEQKYIAGFAATDGSIKTVTVPENASFMRFTQNASSDSNVMLCIGDSLPDYRPYREPTLTDLSALVQKYFPDGMRSAGEVYDSFEVDDDGKVWAVQRVGSITLDGSQFIQLANWRPNDSSVAWAYPKDMFDVKITATFSNMNIIAPGYNTTSYGGIYSSATNSIALMNDSNNIYGLFVRSTNTELTTKNAISAYLAQNPITVYYEKAAENCTLVTDPFPTDLNVEAGGSLTFANDQGADYRVLLPNQETFMIKLGGAQA